MYRITGAIRPKQTKVSAQLIFCPQPDQTDTIRVQNRSTLVSFPAGGSNNFWQVRSSTAVVPLRIVHLSSSPRKHSTPRHSAMWQLRVNNHDRLVAIARFMPRQTRQRKHERRRARCPTPSHGTTTLVHQSRRPCPILMRVSAIPLQASEGRRPAQSSKATTSENLKMKCVH
jgi:hypothetical protein